MARVVPRDGAGIMTNPQVALGIFKQAHDAAVMQLRRVDRIEGAKLFAVESGQTAIGANPNISIMSLRHCGNRILRQTIFGLPNANRVAIFERGAAACTTDESAQPNARAANEDAEDSTMMRGKSLQGVQLRWADEWRRDSIRTQLASLAQVRRATISLSMRPPDLA